MSVSPFARQSVRSYVTKMTKLRQNKKESNKTNKTITPTNCLPSRSCLFPTVRHGVRWGWSGSGCNRASWGSPRLAWISKSIKHHLIIIIQKEVFTLHTKNKFEFRQPASSWAYQTLCVSHCVILWSRSASPCPGVSKAHVQCDNTC